ncbi:MAG: glycoside hydrolase family 88 protein [Lachnospiraceae bacterium]|nr:glycoside hydrolase family 88 protein [Lachnospiraceae bacterium]
MYEDIENYLERLITESTPDKPFWNIESIRQGKPAHWNYIDGCMITALLSLADLTGDKRYYDFAENFIDYYVSEDGSILGYNIDKYNLDDVNEGRVLFELYKKTGKEKYEKAIKLLKKQLDGQPRTVTGNFWHKKIYPNQIWLDGIYMAQVFSALYAKNYLSGDYKDIEDQISNVEKLMKDSETGLYFHGCDCSKEAFWADKNTGCSKNFWLRSIGWFSVALADLVEICDGEAKKTFSRILSDLLNNISRFADKETGIYYQVVDKGSLEGNYLETSGSCMIAYAMLKGARLGLVSKELGMFGQKTFNGICKKYLKNTAEGMSLGGICLVAGLGPENNPRRDGSFEYYISEPVVENDAKGVAPFVLCYTEILRLNK